MAELDVQIGKRLQIARKSLGFKSARSFARQHNIPESTYSQHETGKRSLNPNTMLNYCERLNINPGWLVTGKKPIAAIDFSSLRTILQSELSAISSPELKQHITQIFERCVARYQRNAAAQTPKTEDVVA